MDLNWVKDDREQHCQRGWHYYAELPGGWWLSVLHRLTGFGFDYYETETALRNGYGDDAYFHLMLGDIRDHLKGGESFEEIKSLIENGPTILAHTIISSEKAGS